MTNVRNHTDKELINKTKLLTSFKTIPIGYWILGVRSKQDDADEYDDKFYLFKNNEFILVTSGTTNPGLYGLLNFIKYNTLGCAVVKSNEWYYDLWSNGFHKGKMRALVQVKDILYYRDNNRNKKSEEIGKLYSGRIGINFHTCTYLTNALDKIKGVLVGKWSEGCQVCNIPIDFYKIIDFCKSQYRISYCLIEDF